MAQYSNTRVNTILIDQGDTTNRLLATLIDVMQTGSAPSGGGIAWGAPTAVAVTAGPTSTILIAANASRKAISIWNPAGNAQMSIDIKGGTVTLAAGRPILAGGSIDIDGADCPVTAITFIGTAGQSLVYQEGT